MKKNKRQIRISVAQGLKMFLMTDKSREAGSRNIKIMNDAGNACRTKVYVY